MSTSPSLRLSLRRKRSTRSAENSGSPIIKKSSPTLPESKKEPPSTPKSNKSSHNNNKLSRSGSRRSPRLARLKSKEQDDSEEKTLHTPASTKWTHPTGDSLRQPSPDMPFLSSQLCGSQECEVVWDCDSPGFTKDDLKRMHSSKEAEVPPKPVQITILPHRQLFPRTRSRASRVSSSSNTTAQLNDLLDLLSSKEPARRQKEKKEDPGIHHNTLQPIVPPRSNLSEDSTSSESPALLEPLREASSQPFEVLNAGPKEGDQTLPADNDDSMWGDDLNLGLCDISDSVLTDQVSSRTRSEGASVRSKEVDRSKLPQDTSELSIASADIFDDDLFSDSVILSTQAVEEALSKKDTKNVSSDRTYSSANPQKETQHDVKNTFLKEGHQGQEKDNGVYNSVKNINNNCSKSEVSVHTVLDKNSTTSNGIESVNMKEISENIESSLQRQVRRSFRFGPSPKRAAERAPSLGTEQGNQTLTSVPENQKLFRNREVRGELRKTDTIPVLGTEKSCNTESSSTSNSVSNRLSRAPASWNNLNTQITKAPVVRKSLFRSNNSKSEEVQQRGSIQAARGPLLRSQSSGDARVTTSSPAGRRCHSSMELEASQDLDDDEFFTSLLSMLPEEEGGFSSNRDISLSPIKPVNQSPKPQESVMPPANAKPIPGNRVETRDGRFSKKEAPAVQPQTCSNVPPQNLNKAPTHNQCNIPPQSVSNVPPQNLKKAPTHNQCNIPPRRVSSVPPQNLRSAPSRSLTKLPSQNPSSVPSRNFTNVASQNSSNVPSRNLRNVPSKSLSNIPSQSLCNVPLRNRSHVPSQNLRNMPPQNLCNIPSQNMCKLPPRSACSAPSQSVTNAPSCGFVNGAAHTNRQANPVVMKPQVDPAQKRPVSLVQGVRPSGAGPTATKTKLSDTSKARVGDSGQQQTSDTFDDGLFEDDVLSLIDEVESQLGSQNTPSDPSPSPSPQPQPVKCTQDEIARKKAAALRRREERRRQQCRNERAGHVR